MKGIWNHVRALDLMESLPEAEPGRLGCVGHSLGGHNTIFLTLFDGRIKVAVSSCGLCALKEYAVTNGGNLRGWAQDKYMPIINTVYKNDPGLVPWDFPEIVSAIAPRAVFLNAPLRDSNMNYPGNKIIIDAALSTYRELGAESGFCYINPDAAHSFPDDIREKAYAFVDSVLKA
jgi:dienelactone hydrolase